MISSTLLTLGVVPAVYSLVDQGLRRLHSRRG
jgi:Cu/Ag efflux pump CusA